MKEIEKSLRYFFLIIALLLSSQVFGSSVSQNGSFFYAIFAIIILVQALLVYLENAI